MLVVRLDICSPFCYFICVTAIVYNNSRKTLTRNCVSQATAVNLVDLQVEIGCVKH